MQIIPMQLEITGAVPSKFQIDDYIEDCVNVSALVALDETQGGIGRGAEIFKYKTSTDISEFKDIDFTNPVVADCQVEMVKKGKKMVLVLKSLKFKQPAVQPVKA
ncbi:hypothetical protein [Psychrobacter urativorans]|uniref:hypothetical protein n=1 Tax=Psychrobacter urativorans TaxID=45610 RepID=UPI00191AE2D7|nr:hypothetical protein [Psychrobacter urativorans]